MPVLAYPPNVNRGYTITSLRATPTNVRQSISGNVSDRESEHRESEQRWCRIIRVRDNRSLERRLLVAEVGDDRECIAHVVVGESDDVWRTISILVDAAELRGNGTRYER